MLLQTENEHAAHGHHMVTAGQSFWHLDLDGSCSLLLGFSAIPRNLCILPLLINPNLSDLKYLESPFLPKP